MITKRKKKLLMIIIPLTVFVIIDVAIRPIIPLEAIIQSILYYATRLFDGCYSFENCESIHDEFKDLSPWYPSSVKLS